jgi:Fe-Mn family superoxide dismutase
MNPALSGDTPISRLDYVAAAGKYIDAFFKNIQWDMAASRIAAVSKA